MLVLIVDDRVIIRNALAEIVQFYFPDTVVDEVESLEDARLQLRTRRTSTLLLLSADQREATGDDGIVVLRCPSLWQSRTAIASVRLPGPFQQALRNGSAAFVPKSAGKETLVRAIEAVAGKRARVAAPLVSHLAVQRSDERGRLLAERLERLTPQQRRVLTLIRQGLSNKQIAHILAVGESTVKSHVTQLLRKLEMNTRTQVAVTVTMHDAPPYAEAD